MSETKERDLQTQRLLRIRPDHHAGLHLVIVQQGRAGQLGGQDLDIIPIGQFGARHAHGVDLAVMAGL